MKSNTVTGLAPRVLFVALTAFFLVSCGDDDDGNGGPTDPGDPVATQLAFATQPGDSEAGAAIVAPRAAVELASVVSTSVEILDASGNRVTSATDEVTVALGDNPGGATLSGTTTVAAQNGLATFSDLTIETAATGYTLVASASGLTGATSSSFSITPAAPATVEFVTQPAGAAARATMGAVEVQVMDAFGNLTNGDVTVSLEDNPGAMLLHASGLSDPIVQRIDPVSGTALPPLPNSFEPGTAEILSLVYDPATGLALCTQFDAAGNSLCATDPADGTYAFIGQILAPVSGTFPPFARPLAWEPGGTGRLLAGDINNPTLYEIDPATGNETVIGTVTGTVGGFNGMAVDPTTETIYAAVQQAQIIPPDPARRIRDLVTLDVGTLVATTVGTLSVDGVASIAFMPDGTLYAVTGDGGGGNAETLWTVDKTDGTMTSVLVLGDGDDGEAIAMVPALLSGTLTAATQDGVATFGDLSIDAPASGYTLSASTDGIAATSTAFDITVP